MLSDFQNTLRLLRFMIAGWVLFNYTMLAPQGDIFWGANSLLPINLPTNLTWIEDAFFLLCRSNYSSLWTFFLCGLLLSSVCVFFKNLTLFAFPIMTFFLLNIDHRNPSILDGGNNLIEILCILLSFTNPNITKSNSLYSSIASHFNSTVVLLCRFQIATIYLVAGFRKMTGTLWPKGMALFYTLSIPEYSHPTLMNLVQTHTWAFVLANYITIAFQVSFPFLIWNRSFRPFYLAFGTFLHLGISFGMGLTAFGLAMCVGYFSFYNDNQSNRILEIFTAVSNKIKYPNCQPGRTYASP